MRPDERSQVAKLILERLAEISARMAAVEGRLVELAEDFDTLDRYLRPYGDGTRSRSEKIRRARRHG